MQAISLSFSAELLGKMGKYSSFAVEIGLNVNSRLDLSRTNGMTSGWELVVLDIISSLSEKK